jgi:AraC-like DNA-binding protein
MLGGKYGLALFLLSLITMKFVLHPPCARLKPYVKHFVVSESSEAQAYKVLPGTSLVMGFQYSGRVSYLNTDGDNKLATAGITGLMDSYRVFKNTANTGSVLIVFEETGAAAFFNQPLNELFGASLSLDNFCSQSELTMIEEKLAIAGDDSARIGIIEQFLISRLHPNPGDTMVEMALQYIHQSKGTIRMADLATALHTSASPLEKRFRRVVGASPKKFASIIRVKNVLGALDQNNGDFAAYLAGFYDQAHFIKSFKNFTSVTPGQYLKTISDLKFK